MHQRRDPTSPPSLMRLAFQLAGWVIVALFLPLVLGMFFDKFTGLTPLGLLLGMAVGMLLALIIVLRTITKRLLLLSPIVDEEDNKESL